jgi:hypothetical protein
MIGKRYFFILRQSWVAFDEWLKLVEVGQRRLEGLRYLQ